MVLFSQNHNLNSFDQGKDIWIFFLLLYCCSCSSSCSCSCSTMNTLQIMKSLFFHKKKIYMTHCKHSWNFIFSDIFSILDQFDVVFFASPLFGKSPGTLPHCIDKFGKRGINFNDILLYKKGEKYSEKRKKTCPNSESTFSALFL